MPTQAMMALRVPRHEKVSLWSSLIDSTMTFLVFNKTAVVRFVQEAKYEKPRMPSIQERRTTRRAATMCGLGQLHPKAWSALRHTPLRGVARF